MEPEVQKENTVQVPIVEPIPVIPAQAGKHTSHTYDDDLAKALDATDAKIVQQMLNEGREREQNTIEEKKSKKQKGWYKAGVIILLLFTSLALAYGVYHYKKLTVPAEYSASVGVFPSTETVLFSTTDIRKVVENIKSNNDLGANKPTLVPLVSDEQNLNLLSVNEIFSFFEASPSEPFLTSFNIVRLGIMNTGIENAPFVIASVNNAEIASKELLIAEPGLLQMFYRPLGIDLAEHSQEIGREFTGEYMYNIPVRTVRYNNEERSGNLLFFYGRATDDIVVFTTKPEVLKAIYDSLIRQQS